MQPYRIDPLMPLTAYKTYGLHAPRATHTRAATCAEVKCGAYLRGWKTVVPADSMQADYIRGAGHGRHFIETRAGDGLACFEFPPGQSCFASSEHRLSLEREPIYTVRGGDWRGATSPTRTHARAADWIEDFATNQQAVADRMTRG
jgi:hypothetical protein